MTTVQSPPARGTRPPNRRELIIAAAAELFSRNGFAAVSMSDIAAAVAIGPSALYRHFRSKDQLLATVIADAIAGTDAATQSLASGSLADIAHALAEAALAQRNTGVLWHREARHLPIPARTEQQAQIGVIVERLSRLVRAQRSGLNSADAGLVVHAALSVAHSVSFHRLALPADRYRDLLAEMVESALVAPVGPAQSGQPAVRTGTLQAQSRREAILEESVALFSRRGYAGVSMEDIGTAVGIAGPSLYKHFSSKADILSAALFRGEEWLRRDMSDVFATAGDALQGLAGLVSAYTDFAFDHPYLVQILMSESHHLPDADYRRARAAQRNYISEWLRLAQALHPDWDATTARIRVQAAQMLINEVAIDAGVRSHPAAAVTATAIANDILDIAT